MRLCVCVCVCESEWSREKETEIQRDWQTHTHRHTQTHTNLENSYWWNKLPNEHVKSNLMFLVAFANTGNEAVMYHSVYIKQFQHLPCTNSVLYICWVFDQLPDTTMSAKRITRHVHWVNKKKKKKKKGKIIAWRPRQNTPRPFPCAPTFIKTCVSMHKSVSI